MRPKPRCRSRWKRIQALGGNGYINEFATGRILRDAKLYAIGAGTNEIRRMLIGGSCSTAELSDPRCSRAAKSLTANGGDPVCRTAANGPRIGTVPAPPCRPDLPRLRSMSDIVIVGAKRTAIGSFLGQFTGVPTTTLGTAAISGALEQAGVAPDQVDEVIMGCVLPAGLGQAPARQAAIGAKIPTSAGATTINKVCGSGMKAVMLAHDLIKAGSANVVVAGGMESMTNAPHLLNGSRTGTKFGAAEMLDHMA